MMGIAKEAILAEIRRQDEAAEWAASDARALSAEKKRASASDGAWRINSPIIEPVAQTSVPELMKATLDEVLIERDGVKKLLSALKIRRGSLLNNYADGTAKMAYSVGLHFVHYLEARRIEKEKAVPAATGTAQRSEDTQHETSPDIVPQSQEDHKMKEQIINAAGEEVEQQPDNDEVSALRAELRNAEEALEKEQKESAARLIKLEEAQAGLEEKTLEAADLRAKLKTRTDETVDLRAQINELNSALDTATAKLASVQGREMEELERENDMLRRRIAQFEVDDASCGPARVEQLETQVEKAQRQHVEDLELIRDMCRNLLDWRGDE